MATEKRLIDANAIPESATAISTEGRLYIPWSAIVEAPTVDAVEVVHGMWLWYTEDIYTCSNCYGKVHVKEVMGQPDYHYCPNCGAKMDGERRTDV